MENRKITKEQGMEFAQTYGMKYLETSAKTALNVNETFVTMTKDIIALNSEKDKAIKKGIQYCPLYYNYFFLDEKSAGFKFENKDKFQNIQKKG